MNPPQPSAAAPPPSCDSCGVTQHLSLIIHNCRYQAKNRLFCTNCVLRHHRGSFCPFCFDVYCDGSPPPHQRLMCLRCPAIAHRSCASPSASAGSAVFHCPICTDPSLSYFKLSAADRNSGALDLHSAKVLVAAARIAARTMSRAAAAARFDAERRAKEAAVARKKAREALEHLASIVAKEQEEKEALTEEQRGVSGQNDGLRVT